MLDRPFPNGMVDAAHGQIYRSLMCVEAALTLSFVIRSELDTGALPNAKLTRCSRSSSSVMVLFRDSSKRRINSGSGTGMFWNCFRSAMDLL